MKAPAFWAVRDGREAAPLTRALLQPFALAYARVTAWKIARARPFDPGAPVICIGNLTLGGAGKTPVAIAVLRALKARHLIVYGLSRGYGGSRRGPLLVDPRHHDADDVGDEPLLLARETRVVVGRDRASAAAFARQSGARILVMDDGHQNPAVQKVLSIVVIDAAAGFGNGRVFPAGPLREPVKNGLARADAVVLIGDLATASSDVALALKDFSGSVLEAYLAPTGPAPAGPLVAFAGIGRPEKFFDSLRAAGADVRDGVGFADHHRYTARDLEALKKLAESHAARLITTEKDAVRLPARWRDDIVVYPVTACFRDPAALAALLARVGAAPKPELVHGAGAA